LNVYEQDETRSPPGKEPKIPKNQILQLSPSRRKSAKPHKTSAATSIEGKNLFRVQFGTARLLMQLKLNQQPDN
jgi:hypothetical protein